MNNIIIVLLCTGLLWRNKRRH